MAGQCTAAIRTSTDITILKRGIVRQQDEKEDDDFHLLLSRRWKESAERLCRYSITNLQTKILPGKHGFVAQFNPARTGPNFRRKPQDLRSVDPPPVDLEGFNFNRVGADEVLMSSGEFGLGQGDILLLNISPLEFGSSLLVPRVGWNIPQRVTLHGLTLLIDTMLVSPNRYLRAGFSSPGGYASVNHQHFHLYYMKEELPVENVEVEHIAGPCYAIKGYPAKGFAFQLDDDDNSKQLARDVLTLVTFLCDKKVAHNLFLTHRGRFDGQGDTLTVFLWARESSFGKAERADFNTGLCELAGHLIIKDAINFEGMDENVASKVLEELTTPWFHSIRAWIPVLFQQVCKIER